MELLLHLRGLEGRRVGLSLVDGTRIDECQLVSVAPTGHRTVWVYRNGEDAFIPLGDICDAWPAPQDTTVGNVEHAMVPIGGLMIGQTTMDGAGLPSLRVVVIDPGVDMVQTEDSAGAVLTDTIDHFLASHPRL